MSTMIEVFWDLDDEGQEPEVDVFHLEPTGEELEADSKVVYDSGYGKQGL